VTRSWGRRPSASDEPGRDAVDQQDVVAGPREGGAGGATDRASPVDGDRHGPLKYHRAPEASTRGHRARVVRSGGMTKLAPDAIFTGGTVLTLDSRGRTAEALAVVKNAGFTDAVHVGGGVLAWVSQVDPSLPSY